MKQSKAASGRRAKINETSYKGWNGAGKGMRYYKLKEWRIIKSFKQEYKGEQRVVLKLDHKKLYLSGGFSRSSSRFGVGFFTKNSINLENVFCRYIMCLI